MSFYKPEGHPPLSMSLGRVQGPASHTPEPASSAAVQFSPGASTGRGEGLSRQRVPLGSSVCSQDSVQTLEEQIRPKTPDFSGPRPSALVCAHAQPLLDPRLCMCRFALARLLPGTPLPLHVWPSPHVMIHPMEGMACSPGGLRERVGKTSWSVVPSPRKLGGQAGPGIGSAGRGGLARFAGLCETLGTGS